MKRILGSESGQALAEFALFTPFFLVMVFGVIDLSFFLTEVMATQEAAVEGANYGSAPGNQNDDSGMQTWAAYAGSYGITLTGTPTATTFYTCTPGGTHVTATTSCSSGFGPMEYVQVTASTTLSPVLASWMFGSETYSATATYRVAYKE
jgi:Flp pilus assembly protein TadG